MYDDNKQEKDSVMKKYLAFFVLFLFVGDSISYASSFYEEYAKYGDRQIKRSFKKRYYQRVPEEELSKRAYAKRPGSIQTSRIDDNDKVLRISSRVSKVLQDIADTTKKFAQAAVPIVMIAGASASYLAKIGIEVTPYILKLTL